MNITFVFKRVSKNTVYFLMGVSSLVVGEGMRGETKSDAYCLVVKSKLLTPMRAGFFQLLRTLKGPFPTEEPVRWALPTSLKVTVWPPAILDKLVEASTSTP